MWRYDIVPGILLILFIINFALAAPVLVQEERQAHVDEVHVSRDMITVLGKRGVDFPELVEEFSTRLPMGKPVESSGAHASSSATQLGPEHEPTNEVVAAPNPASPTANSNLLTEPLPVSPGSASTASWGDALSNHEWLEGANHEWDGPIHTATSTDYGSDHESTNVVQSSEAPSPAPLTANPNLLIEPLSPSPKASTAPSGDKPSNLGGWDEPVHTTTLTDHGSDHELTNVVQAPEAAHTTTTTTTTTDSDPRTGWSTTNPKLLTGPLNPSSQVPTAPWGVEPSNHVWSPDDFGRESTGSNDLQPNPEDPNFDRNHGMNSKDHAQQEQRPNALSVPGFSNLQPLNDPFHQANLMKLEDAHWEEPASPKESDQGARTWLDMTSNVWAWLQKHWASGDLKPLVLKSGPMPNIRPDIWDVRQPSQGPSKKPAPSDPGPSNPAQWTYSDSDVSLGSDLSFGSDKSSDYHSLKGEEGPVSPSSSQGSSKELDNEVAQGPPVIPGMTDAELEEAARLYAVKGKAKLLGRISGTTGDVG